jgi:hypothetical protein
VDTQTNSTEPTGKPERVSFSIADFCYRNDISLSTYHKMKRLNLGPREMRLNTVVRITLDSERKWQEARSNPRGAEAEAKAAAQEIASARGRRAGQLAVQSPRHVANIKRAARTGA